MTSPATAVGSRRVGSIRSSDWDNTRGGVGVGGDIPRIFLWLIDLGMLILAFQVAYLLAPVAKRLALSSPAMAGAVAVLSPQLGGDYRPFNEVLWVLLILAPATMLCLQAMGAYRPILLQSRTRIVVSTVLSPSVGLGAVTLVLFTLRSPSWSRLFIFSFTVLGSFALCGYRLALRSYRSRRVASGFYARNVVLIGPMASVQWIAEHLERTTSRQQYQVLGYLSLPQHAATAGGNLASLGRVEEFGSLLVHQPIHEAIVIQGDGASEWLKLVVDSCDYFRVTLRVVPEALLLGQLRDLQFLYHSDPLKLPEVVLRPRDFDSDALFVKRLVDIGVSGLLLIVLSPLFLLIALAIKLSTPSLAIFYPWQVVGYKGRRFTGYKFSTMVADADLMRNDLLDRNEMQGPVFKIRQDPRVTTVGRFLRKFSLNELPQLWSVLKGDMSLVGPRPAFPHELERYELWHKRKLCVRPGMTCLWQVSGRNKIKDFDTWVRLDLEYIDSWTLWLDVKILARTIWTVVGGTGW